GDISGDGKSDLVAVRKREDGKAVASIRLASADGLVEATELELGTWIADTRYLLGDATGDGKADLWVVSQSANQKTQVTLWSRDGETFTQGPKAKSNHAWDVGQQYILSDINRSGRQTLTVVFPSGSTDKTSTFIVAEDGTMAMVSDYESFGAASRQYLKADVQDDGRDEWIKVYQDAQGVDHLRPSSDDDGNGEWGWSSFKDIAVGKKAQSRYLAADLNGDGRTDVVQLWRNGAGLAVATAWLSDSNGYVQGSDSVLGAWR
ncbi:hypothetical protein, partial [Chitinimonas sp. BJB300]